MSDPSGAQACRLSVDVARPKSLVGAAPTDPEGRVAEHATGSVDRWGDAAGALSCVLPVYNEREVIGAVVARLVASLERLRTNFEIIVVDDGSTDGTGAILDALADPHVRVIHLDRNAGYGCALRTGFGVATHPLVFFMDSDDQFDPDDIAALLTQDADIVVGYRAHRDDTRVRAWLSNGYNVLVRAILGVRARDVNCAFKLIRRQALARLDLRARGYAINAEMLARAARMGLRVQEVPVRHYGRRAGQSKVGWGDIPRSLAALVQLRRALGAGEESQRD